VQVEAILLFSAVVVNLMGIMYSSVEKTALAAAAQPQLTVVIIIVVTVSIGYYLVVLFGEIYMQCEWPLAPAPAAATLNFMPRSPAARRQLLRAQAPRAPSASAWRRARAAARV